MSFSVCEIQTERLTSLGGMYLEGSYENGVRFRKAPCPRTVFPNQRYRRVMFSGVNVTQNTAENSGSGLYVGSISNFTYVCHDNDTGIDDVLEGHVFGNRTCLTVTDNRMLVSLFPISIITLSLLFI